MHIGSEQSLLAHGGAPLLLDVLGPLDDVVIPPPLVDVIEAVVPLAEDPWPTLPPVSSAT
jgi:hypothetical protein